MSSLDNKAVLENRANQAITHFLSSDTPEVLSITGRWGVGKTYAWKQGISAKQANSIGRLRRYAYVSAFGLRSIESLKTAIVQSTIRLDKGSFEPTWESFADNLAEEGLSAHAERVGRTGFRRVLDVLSGSSGLLKAAGVLIPSVDLFIRNQIVCIDDIERSGQGLDLADILGFVSSLKEQKACKVVLLLNEEGLGETLPILRRYLEKVVDQSVTFEPSPAMSAKAALGTDAVDNMLAKRTTDLGITNIRVIRRIRRFLSLIETDLAKFHPSVSKQAVDSIALLGWCIFEPNIAPNVEEVKSFNRFRNSQQRSASGRDDSKQLYNLLVGYGFGRMDDFDSVILEGLQAGWFNMDALLREATLLDRSYTVSGLREAIQAPWYLLSGSLEENYEEVINAIYSTGLNYAEHIDVHQMSDRISFLRQLEEFEKVEKLLQVYLQKQTDKPREHFARAVVAEPPIDHEIKDAFLHRLGEMPLSYDAKEVLLRIARNHGWAREDIIFLVSLSVDQLYDVVKSLQGDDILIVINFILGFEELDSPEPSQKLIAGTMRLVLKKISSEGKLNKFRMRRYLGPV